MKPIFSRVAMDRFFFYLQLFCNTLIGIFIGLVIGLFIVCKMTIIEKTNLPSRVISVQRGDIMVVK